MEKCLDGGISEEISEEISGETLDGISGEYNEECLKEPLQEFQ